MPESDSLVAPTLPHQLRRHAERLASRTALIFRDDDQREEAWSYQQLWEKACGVASALPSTESLASSETGEADPPRALLLFPPGIEFVAGLLGCQIAGWIPVPTCYPKAGREMPRLDSAARDCRPAALVCDTSTDELIRDEQLCPEARSLPRILTDSVASASSVTTWNEFELDPNQLALLQYTSGSTSEPKGVMVRHRNLMANLEAIRRGFEIDWQSHDLQRVDTGVFWLPFFHDMGLIGGILEPLYVGGTTVLISPRSFLQRPVRWLQCITDHQAVVSGAPNFAYQLCVDRITPEQAESLDLHSLKVAFSGAEPVLARTLDEFANRFSAAGFNRRVFYPCYGLAEATLMATGGEAGSEPTVITVDRDALGNGHPRPVERRDVRQTRKLVSCGTPVHGTELCIVDPETNQVVSETVGEIWLRGESIAAGYWNRREENKERFEAQLADGRDGFFRTGDLGFIHGGELYVTGRLKDVIIIRGRNLFPHDIETTVREVVGREGGLAAAFSVEAARGESLAIIAELPRRMDESDLPELARSIRRAIIDVHEVDPRHVCLVRQATIPLTSSGKIRHVRCREMFDAGELKTRYRYDRNSAVEQTPIAMPDLPSHPQAQDRRAMIAEIERWMANWLVARAGVEASDIDLDKPFADYGLDSMTAVEMSGDIEDWSGIELTPVVAWNYPTATRLSAYLVDQLLGSDTFAAAAGDLSEAELEGLLDEIEQLSDDETDERLAD